MPLLKCGSLFIYTATFAALPIILRYPDEVMFPTAFKHSAPDMEKVAFNTTLGRTWRSRRRLVRAPANTPIHSNSPHSSQIVLSSREADKNPELIPLPITENDVDKIEVPGYTPLAEQRLHISQASFNRSHSMVELMAVTNHDKKQEQPKVFRIFVSSHGFSDSL